MHYDAFTADLVWRYFVWRVTPRRQTLLVAMAAVPLFEGGFTQACYFWNKIRQGCAIAKSTKHSATNAHAR